MNLIRPPATALGPLDRLHDQFHFLVASHDDEHGRAAGFDESRGGKGIADRIGPAAIDGEQAVAGLESGLRRGPIL